MINTKKRIRGNWIHIILVLIIGFSGVGIYVLTTGLNQVEESSLRFDQFMTTEMKEIVKNEVLSRVDELDYELTLIRESEKARTRTKVQLFAKEIIESVSYNTDPLVMKTDLINYLNTTANNEQDLDFFVLDMTGEVLRASVDQRNVGANLYDEKDATGHYFVRDILKAKENPEGIYVTYYWSKEIDAVAIEKTSYCYYLPYFDVVIGTGSYEDDVEAVLQNSIYDRLQAYYENRENYVFIVGYDGIARVFSDASFLGKTTSHIKSIDDVSLHEMFLSQVIDQGAGFVNYKYNKRNTDTISEKTTYVMPIDELEVYIGMGFHNDDLNKEMLAYNAEFKAHHNAEVVMAIIGLFVTSLIVFVLIDRGLKLQNKYLKQEDVVFEQLSYLSDEGVFILTSDGELLYYNRVIEQVFGEALYQYIQNGTLELEEVRERVYKMKSASNREYFVEYKYEFIVYHDQDCRIYFIKDITEQMLETNVFKKQALLDELTGLPNRRQLVNDYEDYCYTSKEDEHLVLVMIDLDNFKMINDTYGHDRGDQVLKCLSEVFKDRLREHDHIYRYGGEEFVVSLKDIKIENAKVLLDKINEQFKLMTFKRFDHEITFSGGMILVKDHGVPSSLSRHLKRADDLLYKAKEGGRNRIEY